MTPAIVDTFADEHFKGNPAAVVMFSDGLPTQEEMQSTASRLGLPAIAFVDRKDLVGYEIRWFTPCKELNLCGHATLAAAAWLFEAGQVLPDDALCFHSHSGRLYAKRVDGLIRLDLPRIDVQACETPLGLEEALGGSVVQCSRSADDLIMEVASEEIVASLRPDFERLRRMPGRGQVVTALSAGRDADFVSRSFFPGLGVDEDQVCVSAHCKLGPYWADRLAKDRLVAVQLSCRGGRLLIEVARDRVGVAGSYRMR